MRRRRRRLQLLESEVATARAEHAELRQRLAAFEAIAAAAGATADGVGPAGRWRRPVPTAPMPAGLLAAARDLRSDDTAVRIDVAGSDLVAVVGGAGDPREWWTAIWQFAGPEATGPEPTGPEPTRPEATRPEATGPRPAGQAPASPDSTDPGPAGPAPAGPTTAGPATAGAGTASADPAPTGPERANPAAAGQQPAGPDGPPA